jgi:DNA primase
VQDWATKTISEGEEMLKDVYDASKPGKLTAFGKAQLACGTGVFDSEWVILVEGRADVINLLRAGFDNAIAIEGAKIDETITKLTEGKKVIAFLDGDRAGDLILKELQGLVKIDKILRAPMGREVEECTPLEIAEILKEAMPFVTANGQQQRAQSLQQAESIQLQKQERQEQIDEQQLQITAHNTSNTKEEDTGILTAVKEVYPQINETLEAVVLDGSMKTLLKVPVSDIVKKLNSTEGAKMLVLDGIVTQRLVEAADRVGIEYIVGHRTGELKKSTDVRVRTFGDMGINN